jgi:hypothetical protein
MDPMNLPDDLYRQITEAITVVGEDDAAQPGDRRSPRVKLCTQVSLYPWTCPADSFSVRIRDLSAGGIGILHSQRLPLDSQFVVRLPRAGGSGPLLLLYTVVFWEPLAEKLNKNGARFERVVAESELAAQQRAMTAPSNVNMFSKLTHAFGRRAAS